MLHRVFLALVLLAAPGFCAPLAEKAVPADLPAIMAIERTSFDPAERWDRASWAQTLTDSEQTVLVLRDGARAAAAIAYNRNDDSKAKRLYIMSLGVHPDYRQRGYGEALMRATLEEARKDPALVGASLHVRADNERAQALYRKLGFRAAKRIRRYYEELGVDGLYMVWDKARPRP